MKIAAHLCMEGSRYLKYFRSYHLSPDLLLTFLLSFDLYVIHRLNDRSSPMSQKRLNMDFRRCIILWVMTLSQ